MDEVTLIIRLLQDNWTSSATALVNASEITASHNATPKFIDIRSIEPQEGRRVDIDSESVIVVFEDSASSITLLETKTSHSPYTYEFYIEGT